jgi:hypothetical protein
MHHNLPQLLHGPYQAPSLYFGERALCLLRDCQVKVTSWTAAPISWPRCCAEGTHGGGSGLLLAGDLVRAVQCESAAAIMAHWGVTDGTVWRWRKCLGISRDGTEGSRLAIRRAAEMGGDAIRGKSKGPEWAERCRQTARRLNIGQRLQPGYHGPRWTLAEVQLLGTLPDAEVASRVGKSRDAVRRKRSKHGIPPCTPR